MIGVLVALALNGFREARRNRVSVVIVAFTIALLFSSTLVAETTVFTMQRVLTDFGQGMMALTLVLLAIFLASSQLTREIERKTVFLIVSKPVPRAVFLFGRFAGTILTLTVLLVAMTALFLVQVKLYGLSIQSYHFWAALGLWLELFAVCSIGFFFASFAGQLTASVTSVGLYFAGHLANDMYALSEQLSGPARVLARSAYYLLPNLSRVNYRSLAAYEMTPNVGEALVSAAYLLAYSGLFLSAAVLLFQKRDFK